MWRSPHHGFLWHYVKLDCLINVLVLVTWFVIKITLQLTCVIWLVLICVMCNVTNMGTNTTMSKPNFTHKFVICDTFVILLRWLHLQWQLCWPFHNLLSHDITPSTYHKVNTTVFVGLIIVIPLFRTLQMYHIINLWVTLSLLINKHTCINTHISNIIHLSTTQLLISLQIGITM